MAKKTDPTTLRRHLAEWLALGAVLLLAGSGLAFSHLAESARQQETEHERLRVLAALLANNIETDLQATNAALAGIIHDYLGAPPGPAVALELPRRLDAMVGAMPGVRALVVLDRDGVATASSMPDVIGRNFSQRAYFQSMLRAPDAATLYVAAPYRSIRGDLIISVARMVPRKDGGFGGVVLATLDPKYFTAKFRTAMYAPDVWAVAAHGDGRQLLNYPSRPGIDGTNLDRPGTFFRRHRDSALRQNILSGKVYLTGEQRVMALETIRPPSLHMDRAIVIGLSRDEAAIAAPLRGQARAYLLVSGLLALCAAAVLYWMQRRRAHLAGWRAGQEEERQAMLAIAGSEARFRTLIEDAPLAIAILRGGHFIYSNPRYRALHGYAAEDDLAGLPWRAMIAAESRAVLAGHEALIEADSPSEQRFEALGLGKQGRPVPVLKTTTRVMLADGPATLIFAQDISAQKRAEEDMARARDAAEAANRSKAQFLANMSHEIRSPLNAILGMTWLLERARLEPEPQAMTRKIRAAGQSLLSIVNDVLDVSKIEAGHMQIEQAPFCLADVLDKVASGMAVAATGKPLALLVDALRLEQVLVNLTGNAVKFTATGQVELRIAVEGCVGDVVRLRFCVRDSGIGIATDMREAVFSAFTQADNSTTRRFGGTGLGLTICRQLVQLMGGELALQSEAGVGSEFSFTIALRLLPAIPPCPAGLPAHEPPRRALQDVCVLVVDDSEINRDVAGQILRDQGARPVFAHDGQQALDWLCAHPALADIVLMDVQMPVMDGIEATRRLRRMAQFDSLPVIALTAGAFKAQQEAALQAGMAAFIGKPFDVPATIALIARLHRRQSGAHSARPLAVIPAATTDGGRERAFDLRQGLALWLDEAPYRQHLERFGDAHGGSAALIGRYLDAGEAGAALALAHKLSGIAGNLALPALHRAAQATERLLASGAEARGSLAPLAAELARAVDAIAAYLRDSPAALRATAACGTGAQALLERLITALDADDPAPAEALLDQLRLLLPAGDIELIAAPLSCFDFRGAETAARSLSMRHPSSIEE
ncbi:ATP-binding protein [Janthinobacterium sp. J1-1]|uniref:ATP-binding protein n=1 Tax=Janthinobacterium sp. J1-1 TaxID=3065910 RepID=UPI002811C29F|nr:ATP-binding protein [Janthinobacterium sp. J1-1]